TAKDGSKKSASIKLTIEPIDPSLFTLNTGSVTVKAGETSQITATLLGQLEGQQISWKTSNAAIAVVDGNGLITGIGSGTATISAAVSGLTRTVTVTVQPNTDVNYRVLIAGEYTNSSQSGYLKFAANGLNAVKSAFEMSNIDGARYEIMTLNNPSEAAVLNGIRDFFSDAKEGDVSVLYLLSHGTNTNGEYRWKIAGSTNYITEKELTSVLEGINGNVVLNLCSCYAGEYINDYTNAASTSLMNVVSTVNGYRSGNSKISIIAANTGYLDSCYTDTSAATSFDFFTRAFNEALGWDQQSKAAYEDGLHADANGDGKVTLLELATYVKEKVKTDIKEYVAQNGASSVKNSTAQDPQYYLTTPDLVVYARAKAQ
ncbi:MAG: caspase family protein, partial [Clostridia bacterium]|nr:caspase family protein [Clostridia bacterium]